MELPENPYTNLPFSGEMFGTKEMWSSFDCDFEPRSFDGKPNGKWTGAKLTEKLPWGASVYLPWTFRLQVNLLFLPGLPWELPWSFRGASVCEGKRKSIF